MAYVTSSLLAFIPPYSSLYSSSAKPLHLFQSFGWSPGVIHMPIPSRDAVTLVPKSARNPAKLFNTQDHHRPNDRTGLRSVWVFQISAARCLPVKYSSVYSGCTCLIGIFHGKIPTSTRLRWRQRRRQTWAYQTGTFTLPQALSHNMARVRPQPSTLFNWPVHHLQEQGRT